MSKKKAEKINILALGNSSVGKTSFILRFTEDTFRDIYLTTIGMDYREKYLKLPNNKEYCINFYDTAGQEKYRSLAFNIIKNADGALLMYDLTKRNTFEAISSWMDDIKKHKGEDFHIVLVGNKSDIEKREVTKEEGEELAKKYNISFFETSNKTGQNVEESSMELINKIIEKFERDKLLGKEDDNYNIKLNKKTSKKKHNNHCFQKMNCKTN